MTEKGDSKNFSVEIESIFGQEMFENVKKEPNSDEEVGLLLVAPRGIEPLFSPWEGDVLTAWPWGRIANIFYHI